MTDSLSVGIVCVRFLGHLSEIRELGHCDGDQIRKEPVEVVQPLPRKPAGHLLGEMFGHVQLPDSFTQE